MSIREQFITDIACHPVKTGNKVTIVGCGAVGMGCAICLLTQHVTVDLVIFDLMADKLKGEMLDLQQGSLFLHGARISSGDDFEVTAGSKIIIVTAGARQKEGETRLALLQRNVDIMKSIIPGLAKHSPDAIFLIVSNPVDILSYVVWKISGFPKGRVLGTGCTLDSSRFRIMLSEKLEVCSSSVHGWIIGEHGDSSVPVWSSVNVAGVRLTDIDPYIGTERDRFGFKDIHKDVVSSAYEVIKLKGYTSWAIALAVMAICKAMLGTTAEIHSVSVYAQGILGIEEECFISLPATLGIQGVMAIINQSLTREEKEKFLKTAGMLAEKIKDIKI